MFNYWNEMEHFSEENPEIVLTLRFEDLKYVSSNREYIEPRHEISNNAQADLSLCWSHIPHCWKSHVVAHVCLRITKSAILLSSQFILKSALASAESESVC